MKNKREKAEKVLSVIFILIIWQAAAMIIGKTFIFASPAEAFKTLIELMKTTEFYGKIWYSFSRISLGFLSAFILGISFAILSSVFRIIEILLNPIVVTVKTVPVASFIVIALVWLSSSKLSAFISFLMVFPVIYTNLLNAIKNRDKKMDEMAKVFRIPVRKRILSVYAPQIETALISSCSVSIGLLWKAGVAAEVIGIPDGSIGEALYMSKIHLDTPSLFAWTAVIVGISVISEKVFIFILLKVLKAAERL